MKKILFISHDASRTGAPLLLIWLIKWLKINKAIDPYVLLLNDGVLKNDFEEIAKTFLWENSFQNLSFLKRLFVKFKLLSVRSNYQKHLLNKLKTIGPDYLYFNSIVSSPLIPFLKGQLGCPTILHVHEYKSIIHQFDLDGDVSNGFKYVDQFITVSEIVNQNLLLNYGIKNENSIIVYEYIDFTRYKPIPKKLNSERIIIGGGGLVHWRKGVEFFIIVANYFKKKYPKINIEFWWIGVVKPNDRIYLEQDIIKLGLQDTVFLKGEIIEMSDVLNEIDLFLITSREDPFPVIAIEAAYHYNPLITWNQAIGTKEIIEKGCGETVDYMDFEAMSKAIYHIVNDVDLYNNYAQNSHKVSLELSIDNAGNKIFTLFK
ncbi:MAG: glycosyltransferase family 4 protein [Bacteroidota bacterium]|nr:glycosyltransferase family 4 protein [Bacteroidota bacterium]